MPCYTQLMRFLLFIVAAAFACTAQARPTTYTGGTMGMFAHDGMESSANVFYSPTFRDAIGVRVDHLDEDDSWMHTLNYNRLLKRWNGESSQANLYLLSGIGLAQKGDSENAVGWAGGAIDWENRRYFAGYENRFIASGLIEESFMQRARVGIAPVLVPYEDPQPWLMLQVDHRPSNDAELVVTPLLRVFTSKVLGELGYSSEGDIMLNVTTNF